MIHKHILVIDDDPERTAHLEETPVGDDANVRTFTSADCLAIEQALEAFLIHVAYTFDEWTEHERNLPKPGRYRCSMSADGNFEIGSRL